MSLIKKKLVLHTGLPKTGTSALQRWFRKNQSLLLQEGVNYPDPPGAKSDKHTFLVPELFSQDKLPVLSKLLSEPLLPLTLLSNEGLSNHLQDFSVGALSNFRELTAGMDVTVILVTRAAEPWLKSYHRQCVLNPKNDASPLWGTGLTADEISSSPRVCALLDHRKLLADLGIAYGADRTLHYQYEDPGWFLELLREIGLGHLDNPSLPRMNESLPDWAIETVRQINIAVADNTERLRWIAALQTFLKSSNTILIAAAEKCSPGGVMPVLDLGVLDSISTLIGSEGFRSFSAFVHHHHNLPA